MTKLWRNTKIGSSIKEKKESPVLTIPISPKNKKKAHSLSTRYFNNKFCPMLVAVARV